MAAKEGRYTLTMAQDLYDRLVAKAGDRQASIKSVVEATLRRGLQLIEWMEDPNVTIIIRRKRADGTDQDTEVLAIW